MDKLNNELLDTLTSWVRSAFSDKEQIITDFTFELEELYDTDYEEDNFEMPDDKEILAFVNGLYDKYVPKQNGNNFSRLIKVFDDLSHHSIITIHNAGYTKQDGFHEVSVAEEELGKLDIVPKGFCFYHQQDIERAMSDTNPYLLLAFYSIPGDDNAAISVGEVIVESLVNEGFAVSWNQSNSERIRIDNFVWDKALDETNYGVQRSIKIIKELNSK